MLQGHFFFLKKQIKESLSSLRNDFIPGNTANLTAPAHGTIVIVCVVCAEGRGGGQYKYWPREERQDTKWKWNDSEFNDDIKTWKITQRAKKAQMSWEELAASHQIQITNTSDSGAQQNIPTAEWKIWRETVGWRFEDMFLCPFVCLS